MRSIPHGCIRERLVNSTAFTVRLNTHLAYSSAQLAIICGDDVAFVCSDTLDETVVGVCALVCAWKTNRGWATLQSRKCQERI